MSIVNIIYDIYYQIKKNLAKESRLEYDVCVLCVETGTFGIESAVL